MTLKILTLKLLRKNALKYSLLILSSQYYNIRRKKKKYRYSQYSYFDNQCFTVLQKEVFGQQLKPGEFDKLPPKDQQDKSEAMIRLMQKWREERRAKELARDKDAF